MPAESLEKPDPAEIADGKPVDSGAVPSVAILPSSQSVDRINAMLAGLIEDGLLTRRSDGKPEGDD